MIKSQVINYMIWRKLAAALSILLVLGSIGSLLTKGLVLGLDFTGGTQIEVGFGQDANLEKIRGQLVNAGFESPVLVHFGSTRDVLIKFQDPLSAGTEERI